MPPEHISRTEQYDVIVELLKLRNWLYNGEIELIESFGRQLTNRDLSEKQIVLLTKIRGRIGHRRQTKIVSGGGPGSGKRH